jgi:hypothetical protein
MTELSSTTVSTAARCTNAAREKRRNPAAVSSPPPQCSLMPFRACRRKTGDQALWSKRHGAAARPRAIRNKTYPINEILEALATYNRGCSLEETSRRLSSQYGHRIDPATLSRWLTAHPRLTTYRRLRARGLNLFKPPQLIRTFSFITVRFTNSLTTARNSHCCVRARLTTNAPATSDLPGSPIFWKQRTRVRLTNFFSAKMEHAAAPPEVLAPQPRRNS